MTFKRALLAGGVLATGAWSGAALAQPFQGFYVNLGGGYNWRDQVDLKSASFVPSGLTVQGSSGYVGLGSVGYGFGNGLRLEVEGDYRQNDVNRITTTLVPAQASGKTRTYAAMANAMFDLDIGVPWLFPYLGAGAGYAWRDLDDVSLTSISVPPSYLTFNGTNGGFATQAIAGLSFPIPNVPGLSITTEYRFFAAFGSSTYNGTSSSNGTLTAGLRFSDPPARATLKNEYNNGFLVGVRYAFGVQPPPPPPPVQHEVVVPPTRSYLVFFDWDKATLTERARQIIREAADASTHVQYTRIEVNGYTDTSGTPRYNQGLSVRRAEAVAAELVRDGVPRNAISIQGFGETHLLVPTGPGVREPQNRRVEIIIR